MRGVGDSVGDWDGWVCNRWYTHGFGEILPPGFIYSKNQEHLMISGVYIVYDILYVYTYEL